MATRAREAHSRPPAVERPRAFRRQDFTPKELSEDVYVNKIGTFGVSSAGYWWGRAGGALMRLAYYLTGHREALWAMLYADDGKLTGRTDHPERGLLLFLLALVAVKTPLAWKKLRGVRKQNGSATCWT